MKPITIEKLAEKYKAFFFEHIDKSKFAPVERLKPYIDDILETSSENENGDSHLEIQSFFSKDGKPVRFEFRQILEENGETKYFF